VTVTLGIGLAIALVLLLGIAVAADRVGRFGLARQQVVAAVRAVSMFVDGSVERSNLISVASEVLFGFMLVV